MGAVYWLQIHGRDCLFITSSGFLPEAGDMGRSVRWSMALARVPQT